MKKLFIMAALVGLGATAQAKMLAFGVKGGINMPSFETNLGNFESDANVGFHAGVFGQLNIPIIGLGVQPELLYLSQSVSYINKEQNNASKSASYLDIPINITWGIDLKVVRPFIAVTPYLRYSFSEVETYVTTAAASGQAPEPQKLNSFDYGLGAGAGIDLFSKIQLMGRYSWGLSDLVSSGNYKVRSFTLSLGYIF